MIPLLNASACRSCPNRSSYRHPSSVARSVLQLNRAVPNIQQEIHSSDPTGLYRFPSPFAVIVEEGVNAYVADAILAQTSGSESKVGRCRRAR